MTVKRPTLADVATRAGTSTAVVSYVLNDGPRPVSETLRTKVIAALEELDYRPDRVARALRRPRHWRQLGLLVPDVTMPLYAAFVGCFEVVARMREHLLMIGNTGFDPEREIEFARAFTDVGVDGLVAVGAADASALGELCARLRVPVVWVHNSRGLVDARIVGADHVQAGRLTAEHLRDTHRCSDLVFVGGYTEDVRHGDRDTVAQRFSGFSAVAGDSAAVLHTDLTPPGAYAAMTQYLRTHKPPHGVVVGTYGQSASVMRAVTDAGLRVPDDVALVGFDSDPASRYGQIVLTAVRQPIESITETALERLLGPAGGSSSDGSLRPVSLDIGESCGCR